MCEEHLELLLTGEYVSRRGKRRKVRDFRALDDA
jgi:hypothetical protein